MNFDAAEKNKDEKKRKEVLDTLVKEYLSDLSFNDKKPVKEGFKDDDSQSSQEEDAVKKHTLDETLLDPKKLQSLFELSLELKTKEVVEFKTKLESLMENNGESYLIMGLKESFKTSCR